MPLIGFPLERVSPGTGRRHGRDWRDPAPAWADWSKPGSRVVGSLSLERIRSPVPSAVHTGLPQAVTLIMSCASHWPPPASLHPGHFLRVPPDRFLCDSPGRFIRVASCGSHWPSSGSFHPGRSCRFPRIASSAIPQVASSGSLPAVHIGLPQRRFTLVISCGSHCLPPTSLPCASQVPSLGFFPRSCPGRFLCASPGSLPPVMSRSPQVAHPGLAGINPFRRVGFEDNIFEKDNVNSK